MKVENLIEELKKLNQEYEIVLGNQGGYQYHIPITLNECEENCYIIEPTNY